LLRFIYQLAYLSFLLVGGPLYLFKKRRKVSFKGLLKRAGFFSEEEKERLRRIKKSIWIQAVSVGEILSLKPLVDKLERNLPHFNIVITTTTPTGYKVARSLWKEKVFYFPLDIVFVVRKFIESIKPRILVIFETEIWPEVISQMKEKSLPVILINGRISDTSFPHYQKIKDFLEHVLECIDMFFMQSEKYRERIVSLGVPSQKVFSMGNIKYEASQVPLNKQEEEFQEELRMIFSGKKIFLAASTHSGEEEIILSIYLKIKSYYKDTILIIAPRHPERCDEVIRCIKSKGLGFQLFSSGWSFSERDIFIMDKIGFLRILYSLSFVSFVGGSLVPEGGHNILEPAYFSKPIFTGQYFFNFKEIVHNFIEHRAIVVVKDNESFFRWMYKIFSSEEERSILGKRAREVLSHYTGISDSYVRYIVRAVSGKE